MYCLSGSKRNIGIVIWKFRRKRCLFPEGRRERKAGGGVRDSLKILRLLQVDMKSPDKRKHFNQKKQNFGCNL